MGVSGVNDGVEHILPIIAVVHDNVEHILPIIAVVHDNVERILPIIAVVHDNVERILAIIAMVHDNMEHILPITALVLSVFAIIWAVLLKFTFKTKSERIYAASSLGLINLLFSIVDQIDFWKSRTYDTLSSMDNFDPNKQGSFSIEEFNRRDIDNNNKEIIKRIDILYTHQNIFLQYAPAELYVTILRYVDANYRFLEPVYNANKMFYFPKRLESHRYYAAEMIQSFGEYVPDKFKDKWNPEFSKLGGIQFVMKPAPGPGSGLGLLLRNDLAIMFPSLRD